MGTVGSCRDGERRRPLLAGLRLRLFLFVACWLVGARPWGMGRVFDGTGRDRSILQTLVFSPQSSTVSGTHTHKSSSSLPRHFVSLCSIHPLPLPTASHPKALSGSFVSSFARSFIGRRNDPRRRMVSFPSAPSDGARSNENSSNNVVVLLCSLFPYRMSMIPSCRSPPLVVLKNLSLSLPPVVQIEPTDRPTGWAGPGSWTVLPVCVVLCSVVCKQNRETTFLLQHCAVNDRIPYLLPFICFGVSETASPPTVQPWIARPGVAGDCCCWLLLHCCCCIERPFPVTTATTTRSSRTTRRT